MQIAGIAKKALLQESQFAQDSSFLIPGTCSSNIGAVLGKLGWLVTLDDMLRLSRICEVGEA